MSGARHRRALESVLLVSSHGLPIGATSIDGIQLMSNHGNRMAIEEVQRAGDRNGPDMIPRRNDVLDSTD